MISEASPCVGGGVLNSVQSSSLSDSGVAQSRLVAAEVVARHRAADLLEVGGDLGRHIAAIEVVEAGMGELVERVGKTRLAPDGADLRRLAVGEEVRGEARHVLQRLDIAHGLAPLRRAHRHALARVADGIAEEVAPRQPPAEAGGRLHGHRPARDRAGDRERRQGPARRQLVVAFLAVALDGGQRPGRAAGIDEARRPARLGDQHEGVAADRVHLRIDHRDGRRRRDHRLDRVAAGAHDLGRRFRRRPVRRHRHALLADHRLVHLVPSQVRALLPLAAPCQWDWLRWADEVARPPGSP